MACRRSLVGTKSCTTVYHIGVVSSATQAVCVGSSTLASSLCPDFVALSFLGNHSPLPPLYTEYCTTAVWISGAFRLSHGALCGPCPSYIDISTLSPSVSSVHAVDSPWAQPVFTPVTVADPFLVLRNHNRPIRRARHFTWMSVKPQSPCLFGLYSVDIGTRNVAPFHMYHAVSISTVRYTSWAPGTPGPCAMFWLGGTLAHIEYAGRGISPSRKCLSPGLHTCVWRSLKFFSLIVRWCSRMWRLVCLLLRRMVCPVCSWSYSIHPPPVPSISLCSGVHLLLSRNTVSLRMTCRSVDEVAELWYCQRMP